MHACHTRVQTIQTKKNFRNKIMYHFFMCLCFRIVAKKEGRYYEKIEELKEVMLKVSF